MAITIASQPSQISPAYSPQWFRAGSNMIGQPNFKYTIVITDLITSTAVTENKPARPDNNECWFNAQSYFEAFMNQPVPYGNYGWNANTSAYRKVRVNIGETYDVLGVSTYFAGSNYDYYLWNGILNFRDYPTYYQDLYAYDSLTNTAYLSNNKNPNYQFAVPNTPFYMNDRYTYKDRSSYLYVVNEFNYPTATDIEQITIYGYNSGGGLISTTTVTRPDATNADYKKWYCYIDVGYKGLEQMPSGQCSGTFPIPVSQFAYYDIYDTTSTLPENPNPFAEPWIYPIVRYNVLCEPRYDVITLHYLAKAGQFETFSFTKLSERNATTQKTSYGKYPYELISPDISYPQHVGIDITLSVEERNTIKVTSDWLTLEEVVALKELFTSPIVYMDLGGAWTSVKVVTSSYAEKKKYNDKLISVQFDLEYNFTNSSQRG